jgi:hypothetical protein
MPPSGGHHASCRQSVAIRANLGAIFVPLQPSRSKWLVRSISPGAGEKMSKFNIRADDIAASLAHSGELQRKVAHLALFRSLSEVSTVKNGFTIRPLAPTAISAFGVVVMR